MLFNLYHLIYIIDVFHITLLTIWLWDRSFDLKRFVMGVLVLVWVFNCLFGC
jgi:hypothetical protein